jgi:hypothetical protein
VFVIHTVIVTVLAVFIARTFRVATLANLAAFDMPRDPAIVVRSGTGLIAKFGILAFGRERFTTVGANSSVDLASFRVIHDDALMLSSDRTIRKA